MTLATSAANHGDGAPPRLATFALREVTEEAARAASCWSGRADKNRADGAAVDAMRRALDRLPARGVVVVGEGEKDEAPELYRGEVVGSGGEVISYDIAVDPVEGTTYLAKGLTNAMAVIGMAPRGAMLDPGPAFYMEKFAAPAAARDAVDPAWSTERKLRRLAEALAKPVSELTVFVLEKPRHNRLIEEIGAVGARIALYPAGDVAGAILAGFGDGRIDALMGTGGTAEGILSACAIRGMGGVFWGRLDPQLTTEKARVRDAGLSTERWYPVEELVMSPDILFCATGITTGLLFDGVAREGGYHRTQTLMISGNPYERQLLTTWTPVPAAAEEA